MRDEPESYGSLVLYSIGHLLKETVGLFVWGIRPPGPEKWHLKGEVTGDLPINGPARTAMNRVLPKESYPDVSDRCYQCMEDHLERRLQF